MNMYTKEGLIDNHSSAWTSTTVWVGEAVISPPSFCIFTLQGVVLQRDVFVMSPVDQ